MYNKIKEWLNGIQPEVSCRELKQNVVYEFVDKLLVCPCSFILVCPQFIVVKLNFYQIITVTSTFESIKTIHPHISANDEHEFTSTCLASFRP